MPELPEVETVVRELKRKIPGRIFIDAWTDFPKMVKVRSFLIKKKDFGSFKKEIKNQKVRAVRRRGKNILLDLSGGKTILIHQKMTGHLLYGKWKQENGKWKSRLPGPLSDDPYNRFLHVIFFLDNGWQLAFSDVRKFAKVELWTEKELESSPDMKKLGPEPLAKEFTFEKFREAVSGRKGRIKQILMDQTVIAGIGNIYSDEILWRARVHPLKKIAELSGKKLKNIYLAVKKVLPLAIRLGGESFSDFRRLSGKKGFFDKERMVYRREGQKCPECGGLVKRIKIGGRSAHFCPKCQK